MIQPVILCGGDGTRLWPASRKGLPKQFMPLHGSTLFKDTLGRARTLAPEAGPLVICNREHRFLAAAQMQEAGFSLDPNTAAAATIMLEPCGRNTAPAIATAALLHQEHNPVLLVLPSDHRLTDTRPLAKALALSLPLARAGRIVTFGIVPDRPETGYGYIRKGSPLGTDIFAVDRFVEKPDAATAQMFMDSGDHLWNSGMFLATASTILQEFAALAPDILEACRAALEESHHDLDFIRLGEKAFAACRAESLDYAVMEGTTQAAVAPLPALWSDLGSWDSLYDVAPKDPSGNACSGDVSLESCSGSFIMAQSRLVAALGLTDMVLVETADAVLVAPRSRSQEIKKLTATLAGRKELLEHAQVYRPWGSFQGLALGDRFQVKRIIVDPGKRLSLQQHHHRAEHWVVVRGTAKVLIDGREVFLHEDQSTYIPIGGIHRLENPGKIPLELIEIQTGSYLGEDDIVRLEDVYGRVEVEAEEEKKK